jgi:hypothetical protein
VKGGEGAEAGIKFGIKDKGAAPPDVIHLRPPTRALQRRDQRLLTGKPSMDAVHFSHGRAGCTRAKFADGGLVSRGCCMHIAAHSSIYRNRSFTCTSPSIDRYPSRLTARDDGRGDGRPGAVLFPLSGSPLLTQGFPVVQVLHWSLPALSTAGTRVGY